MLWNEIRWNSSKLGSRFSSRDHRGHGEIDEVELAIGGAGVGRRVAVVKEVEVVVRVLHLVGHRGVDFVLGVGAAGAGVAASRAAAS